LAGLMFKNELILFKRSGCLQPSVSCLVMLSSACLRTLRVLTIVKVQEVILINKFRSII
uniref:Ovule protein n=1 Tax=Brugia timori TaxID=42155 RepID=A0A0R3QEG8_9BILA